MAGNLTAQVRNIADVTKAVAAGDLSRKISVDVHGEILDLKDTVNRMVDQLRSFAAEVTRVAREVGTEGKLGGQADVKDVAGTWKDLTDNVNSMAGNLTAQVRNIADVTKAVAAGDLSRKISVDVRGEILDLKDTVNRMVDQLRSFAAEVTRVAREVGTEGKLGGQADVKDVAGTWKDLTDNVNSMASNLTGQVRGIARVVTAVANGDLRRKLTLEAKGEIAELADTINSMIDTLATFADQVTSVAREVGVEGKLGGQARVPGAAGTWKDLTDNVNQLAANLTTQVRAIAEVATAVTTGDLTREIAVAARGEVAVLKDTTNEMIRNLRETTQKNSEQDWLKTNLAKFSRMLQGQKDLLDVGRLILSELAPVVSAHRGAFYLLDASDEQQQRLKLLAGYALEAETPTVFRIGEGLVGQCAREKRGLLLDNVPANYVRISSGLGGATPASLIILPVLFEGDVKGVIELASFDRFSPTHKAFLDLLVESIGIVINTIEANMRTEALLAQSQSLASELGQTNQELQEKAQLLAHQNAEVERKNREVELARQALEEKAAQLALTSKYKSEFLANMSHELRTPLNSLLILSDQLSKNPDGNLSSRQTEFAKTIHASGNDLLNLINDILDLSKIESGTVLVDVGEMVFSDLHGFVERTFSHLAEAKGLEFDIRLLPDLPRAIHTDAKRLQQILKNLLSNAFKFTRHGRVDLTIGPANPADLEHGILDGRGPAVAFSVADTGIGIPTEKQQIIFEAFQQADGSTSRTYGGTGLGLAISRELSRLLGGEIHLASAQGHGSSFTLYLPMTYTPPATPRRPAADAAGAPPVPATRVPVAAVLAETAAATAVEEENDDRRAIQPGDRVLLIVENDTAFARALLDEARAQGFKGVVTSFGAAALSLSQEFRPAAITLDISLLDIDGYWVLERIKNDMTTRHIPVYVITTDDDADRGLRLGARIVITKPLATGEALEQAVAAIKRHADQATRELLIVEPGAARREQLSALLGGPDLRITAVATGSDAIAALERGAPECVVLNPHLPDATPLDVAKYVARNGLERPASLLLYGDADGETHVDAIKRALPGLIAKTVHTEQRLLDQTALYLHRRFADLSPAQRRVLSDLHGGSRALSGRKALIVDDDIRNIFALTSVLEEHHMLVVSAENGRDAVKAFQAYSDIDVVLMDIMMPELDGMETTRQIRQDPRSKHIPIIAVTAKAMKGDREKCIEAGAWDYLAKPVDPEELVAMLRAWLVR